MGKILILASGSPQRRQLLDSTGVPFAVVLADIDEKAINDADPMVRAEKIARAKASKVAAVREGVVMAADTFVVHQSGRWLEKPTSLEEAREILHLQSGSEDTVYTGFCYLDRVAGIDVSATVSVYVRFRALSDREIEHYVRTQPVLTWSGAFSAGYLSGQALIAEVRGSLSALNGLPLETLLPLLKRSGF